MSAQFRTVTVNVALDWPAGMLPDAGIEVMPLTTAAKMLLEPFTKFDTSLTKADEGYYMASERDAVACNMASKFWVDNVKQTNSLAKFMVGVGSKQVEIYSLRGATNAMMRTIDMKGKLTVDRAIHAAIVYMNNNVVSRFADKSNIMTPLARVSITDDNLQALSESLYVDRTQVVKMFNLATARKVQQLSTLKDYDANLAMACLIRSSFSQGASQVTKLIGQRQMGKIANTAGVGGIDESMVASYLSFMSTPDSIKYDVDQIIAESKKMRTLSKERRMFEVAKVMHADNASLSGDEEIAKELSAKINKARK